MNDYSPSPENGEEDARFLVDRDTGEVFRVVKIKDKGKATERLEVASLPLIEGATPLIEVSTQRRAIKPRFTRAQRGAFELMVKSPMTPTEQRVMGFLLLNMGYVNQVQASLCLIAGEIGVPKENVCRALKALQKRGVIVERKAKTFINAPIYVIDPSLYFCGTDDALAIAAAKFHKDLARASEARK